MTEAQFNQKLRDNLPGHFQRIENTAGSGVPDINLCHDGKEIWIESKIVLPQGTLLRKAQYAWGMRRSKNGGKVYVIAKNAYRIHIWRYPDIDVIPWCSKYVKITNYAAAFFEHPHQLRAYLFGNP